MTRPDNGQAANRAIDSTRLLRAGGGNDDQARQPQGNDRGAPNDRQVHGPGFPARCRHAAVPECPGPHQSPRRRLVNRTPVNAPGARRTKSALHRDSHGYSVRARGASSAQAAHDVGPSRVDVVVVAIDGSAYARRAAQWAATEAEHRNAELRLIYAYSLPIAGYAGYSMAPDDLGSIMRAEGKAMLKEVVAGIQVDHPNLAIAPRLFQGDAVVALRNESEHARLTVVGSRGNGRLTGALLGSVALAISSHGTAPVAVVPAEGPGGRPGGPVVVGIDGSATSEDAIAFAFNEAAMRGAPLLAVHTWNDARQAPVDAATVRSLGVEDRERSALFEQLAGWRDKYPEVEVEVVVSRGRATQTLLSYAHRAQLLVVGTRGRGGFAGLLLGSTSHSLITHALCPVIVVRPGNLD